MVELKSILLEERASLEGGLREEEVFGALN